MTEALFDVNVQEWAVDILNGLADELVTSSPSFSHHTGVTTGEGGHVTDLVLADAKVIAVPGFDMRYEGQPLGPDGQMRGNLLMGSKTRTSKKGTKYNIIPINPDSSPGSYHQALEDNPELFLSANMLAAKKGAQAATQFLQGAGLSAEGVSQWVTERYQGAVKQSGGSVVFRTVTDNPSQSASWWYPPTETIDPTSIEEALRDLESWLGGG